MSHPPKLALDLGSGLGFTTMLLKRATGAKRVVGLESSTEFVLAARARFGKDLEFFQHDVTVMSFPTPRADLIYCRFLLTHLAKRKDAMVAWVDHLTDGGLLLAEEVESITTEQSSFKEYLGFVHDLLISQGHSLYVGSEIGCWHHEGTDITSSDVWPVPVPRNKAASMFLLNLTQLREKEWAREHRSPNWFDDLARELDLLRRPGSGGPVIWGVRQHALRRERKSGVGLTTG